MEKRLKDLDRRFDSLADNFGKFNYAITGRVSTIEEKIRLINEQHDKRMAQLEVNFLSVDQLAHRNEADIEKRMNNTIGMASDINNLREHIDHNERIMYFLNKNTPYKNVGDNVGYFKVIGVEVVFSKKDNPMFEYVLEDRMGFKDHVTAIVNEATLMKMDKIYSRPVLKEEAYDKEEVYCEPIPDIPYPKESVLHKYDVRPVVTYTEALIEMSRFDGNKIFPIAIDKMVRSSNVLVYRDDKLIIEFKVLNDATQVVKGQWQARCQLIGGDMNISKTLAVINMGKQLLIY